MLRFACGWTHCPLFPLLLSALGLMAWMLKAGVGVVQPARQEGSQSLDSLIPWGHLVSLSISQRCETLFWLFGVSEAMVENAQPLRTRRFHQMSSLQPQDGTLILAWCQALQSPRSEAHICLPCSCHPGFGDPCCTSHGLCAVRRSREMGFWSLLDFEPWSLLGLSLSPPFPFMPSELNYKTTVWGYSSIDIKVLNLTPTTA